MTNEPSPRPWRVNSVTGGHIVDANGDPVCFCVGNNCGERAALIVDAVNFYDATVDTQLTALLDERDRLRAELADRTRNYEDVIAFHTRTEDGLRDIVRRLISLVNWIEQNDAGAALLREARAAIGEGEP